VVFFKKAKNTVFERSSGIFGWIDADIIARNAKNDSNISFFIEILCN